GCICVGHCDAEKSRGAVRVCLTGHHPGNRLEDEIQRRPAPQLMCGPEARDGTVDKPGIVLAQLVESDAETLCHTGPEVLNNDVGRCCHLLGRLAPLFRLQIEDDAPLTTIERHEVHALTTEEGWAEVACIVASARLH